jgi:hypothetical protein
MSALPRSPAAITGLTCAEVTGRSTNDAAGPSPRQAGLLATAMGDLSSAYDDAFALSPDTTFVVADNQLGFHLGAGVYLRRGIDGKPHRQPDPLGHRR